MRVRVPLTAAQRLRLAQIVSLVAAVVVTVTFIIVFAVPDRIERALFLHQLHAGETRAQVAALAQHLGHRLVTGSGGVGSVEFVLARTICASRSSRIVVFFDGRDRVTRWTALDEFLACSS
ncbi:MAG: hypothetical protein ABSD03_12860 [Vulcanimicrobiaceae bacterium]